MIYDPESSGYVSPFQAAEAARALGYNPSEWEIQDCISSVTGGSEVSYLDFVTVLKQLDSGGASANELKESFAQFDREGKGTLIGAELRYILKTMGEVLTDAELDDLFEQAGFNDQTPINYNDFVAKVMKGVNAPASGGGGKKGKGISKGRERRSMRFAK